MQGYMDKFYDNIATYCAHRKSK